MNYLGIDIGSNSVGSAWIDLKNKQISMGASVFPAGVEESDEKRGAPKNQARRESRGQRKTLARRGISKAKLRKFLMEVGWMPSEPDRIAKWEVLEENNPWLLRQKGLSEELSLHEFGKILLHILNGRGAWWSDNLEDDEEDLEQANDDEKFLKEKVQTTKQLMEKVNAETFGKFMALKYLERTSKKKNSKKEETLRRTRIRNRSNALGEVEYEFCADRQMILKEFLELWKIQKTFKGELSAKLTEGNLEKLYNPTRTDIWKCQGLIFGQRNTYWNISTLGRCDLEPTDRCCTKYDMYAQEFLVLQDVNNIRITHIGEKQRTLTDEERAKVLEVLYTQKSASGTTIRKALGLNRKDDLNNYYVNTDNMTGINTNWFYREVVKVAIGEDYWQRLDEKVKDAINTAIIKLDPEAESDREKFKAGCFKWWSLDGQQSEKLYQLWLKRPSLTKRINF
jgi:CRISPR-associated endonuclease Csn1